MCNAYKSNLKSQNNNHKLFLVSPGFSRVLDNLENGKFIFQILEISSNFKKLGNVMLVGENFNYRMLVHTVYTHI